MTQLESMAARIEELGADHAAVIAVKDIAFDPIYRTYCEANTCGNYGRNWRCPPDEGPIDELIEKAKGFDYAVVYQTIGELEDSFDFEGIMELGERHAEAFDKFADEVRKIYPGTLVLGDGACRRCKTCTYPDAPCRFPDRMVSSMEGSGAVGFTGS